MSYKTPGGTGYLSVRVTTANSAIPLEGAAVTIYTDDDENDVLFELRSGADGRTARVSLPAPSRSVGQTPGDEKPFSTYNMEVSLPGYGRIRYNQVPIYDGITAIQTVNLIPVPENGMPDGATVNEESSGAAGTPGL